MDRAYTTRCSKGSDGRMMDPEWWEENKNEASTIWVLDKPSAVSCSGEGAIEDAFGLCWMVSVFHLFAPAQFLRPLLSDEFMGLISAVYKAGADENLLLDRGAVCPILPAEFRKLYRRYGGEIAKLAANGGDPMSLFFIGVNPAAASRG